MSQDDATNDLNPDDTPVDSEPELTEPFADIAQVLPEAAGGKTLAEALEDSLRNPIAPVVYTPEAQRFPPTQPALEGDDYPARVEDGAPARKEKRFRGDWRHDLIALFFLLATIALCGYYVAFWGDPYGAWNPLAKPTPFVLVTWTPDVIEVVNLSGTQTAEAIPTATSLAPEATAFPQAATTLPETVSTTVRITAAPLLMPFTLADPGVIYAPNANGRGCNWASIAGTVTDLQGQALDGYIVQIVDARAPDRLNVQVFSGAALTFGAGGFEFNLGGSPREGEYIIRLLSPTGIPVSDEFLIFTRNVCSENVVIVNFVQILDF